MNTEFQNAIVENLMFVTFEKEKNYGYIPKNCSMLCWTNKILTDKTLYNSISVNRIIKR